MKFHQLDISLGWSITSTGQLYEKTLGFRHLRACCTLRAYPDAEKRRLACSWTLGNLQGWLKSWWATREEEEVSMVDTGQQGHHDVFFSFILRHNQLWFEVYPTQVSFQPFAFFLTRKVAWDWTPWTLLQLPLTIWILKYLWCRKLWRIFELYFSNRIHSWT